MKVAIFDLDNTLIGGDSDYLWGEFLGENAYVDAKQNRLCHDRYYQDYMMGNFDVNEFLDFQLSILAETEMDTLQIWRERYLREKIDPIILPKATALIGEHRGNGHTLLIITATNRFITEPIAERLAVENLIATEPEIYNGRYTGKITDIPCYAEGKVKRYQQWLQINNYQVDESWFYSDSHSDIPLLKAVTHAIVVDADDLLQKEAEYQGWKNISLR